jgi:hypothetical protein
MSTTRNLSSTLALAFLAASAHAQGAQWIQQFGTLAVDQTYAVAPDGVGGTFVCGSTGDDLYGPNAALFWADAWLARYDAGGTLLWGRQFGTVEDDNAYSVASDGAGGVFVAGGTSGSLGGPANVYGDAWIARYDAAGNQQWLVQFGSSGADSVRRLVPDGSGGVYACGPTSDNLGGPVVGSWDVWLGRWNAAGQSLWLRHFGTEDTDQVNALARSNSGGVFLGGYRDIFLGGTGSEESEGWYAHYDDAGNLSWVREVASASFDAIITLSDDGAGGTLLGGATGGALAGVQHGGLDAWLMRVDASGAPLWSLQLGSSGNDHLMGIAADGQGGLWLAGNTEGNLFAPHAGDSDVWWAQVDGAGQVGLAEQFGTPQYETMTGVAALPGGFVAVGDTYGALATPSAGHADGWIARWDEGCGSTASYCTSSASSIPACAAQLVASGVPDTGEPATFKLSTGLVPGGNIGICLVGANGAASTPFGTLGGKLCVQGPFFRTAPKSGGGATGQCNGNYAFTLQDLINAAPIVVPGAMLNAQVWARDPANADGFLLSNGLEVAVCP